MFKIIVTGPESSGKTTLTKALSNHFKILYANEYAREYLKNFNEDYTQEDLLEIAKGQLTSEKNNILLDTDLITIKIWSNYKYGNCDKWILDQIQKQKSEKRFYLLCNPDIAWEPDLLRENSENRMELFKFYKNELENLNHKYYIIKGKNRIKNAITKILDQNIII
ncbi:MAG: ATP-binding protein [Bacteroidota bacterium]|nr:ATP-binding protein [Bacteroidota bacterium]